jgi:hypothetical protein
MWSCAPSSGSRYGSRATTPPNCPTGQILYLLETQEVWTSYVLFGGPFLGSQHMRAALGADYLKWIEARFGVGIKDYCVYWFRRAQDHLQFGQRAGLVGTNSIAQNRARSASLEYVVSTGGVITDAISSQDWPGTAAVDVSLVNWTKSPPAPPNQYLLDGVEVSGITPDLRTPETSSGQARVLTTNKDRCFQGPSPAGDGFIISASEANELLARTDVNYREVIRPYLTSDDIADGPWQLPRRWIIEPRKSAARGGDEVSSRDYHRAREGQASP